MLVLVLVLVLVLALVLLLLLLLLLRPRTGAMPLPLDSSSSSLSLSRDWSGCIVLRFLVPGTMLSRSISPERRVDEAAATVPVVVALPPFSVFSLSLLLRPLPSPSSVGTACFLAPFAMLLLPPPHCSFCRVNVKAAPPAAAPRWLDWPLALPPPLSSKK